MCAQSICDSISVQGNQRRQAILAVESCLRLVSVIVMAFHWLSDEVLDRMARDPMQEFNPAFRMMPSYACANTLCGHSVESWRFTCPYCGSEKPRYWVHAHAYHVASWHGYQTSGTMLSETRAHYRQSRPYADKSRSPRFPKRQSRSSHDGEPTEPQWSCEVCLKINYAWRTSCRECMALPTPVVE